MTTARCGENGGNVVRIGAKWLVVGGGKLEMGGICGARKKLVDDDVIVGKLLLFSFRPGKSCDV